jgi:CubicO group peptidase (beta-lactamase class C family)
MRSFILVIVLSFVIHTVKSQLYFPPKTGGWATVPIADLNWDESKIEDLKIFLEARSTKSFIILKDGKIAMEYYFNGHDESKIWYWASAGKSLTSVMVAFAEADGKIDLDKPSSAYLGKGWSSCTAEQEEKITVKNHISMTTGLNDANFECTDKECLTYKAEAGTRWAYHNSPYTLLDDIIEGATTQNLNDYFKNKLGSEIGMAGLFIKSGYNNIFYSTARNMAKYGLFVLAEGKWNTKQVLDNPQYISAMKSSSQNLNPSYGYLWWLNGKDKYMVPSSQLKLDGPLIPTAPENMYCALGKNDQKIYILPEQNIVVIRMGDAADGDPNSNVPIVFDKELWARLSAIMKFTTDTEESQYPTLSKEKIAYCFGKKVYIKQNIAVLKSEIIDGMGKQIIRSGKEHQLELPNLPIGIYHIKITDEIGNVYINKFALR